MLPEVWEMGGGKIVSLETGVEPRTPPHDMEAEKSVLGAIMLSQGALIEIIEILKPEDFYKPTHGKIYATVISLFSSGESVDEITVADKLHSKGELETVGDRAYIHSLIETVPTSANALIYASIVKRHSVLRQIIDAGAKISALGYGLPEDERKALDEAESMLFALSKDNQRGKFAELGDVVKQIFEETENLAVRREKGQGDLLTGVPSGFFELDKLTNGFQPSDLIIIAARPSMGKTSLALNMILHAGINLKKPIAFFSLEMSTKEVVQRMLCMKAEINQKNLRSGSIKEEEWVKLTEAMGSLADAPIYIDDSANLSVLELRSKMRRLMSKTKVEFLVLDYIQLMQGEGRYENRHQEISYISRSLKVIGREFGVPVIAVSQLSRDVEKLKRQPVLSDLRESGALEQDADIIMFIYRPDQYKVEAEKSNTAEIIVAKHRNGPTDRVSLMWMENYATFRNLSRQREF